MVGLLTLSVGFVDYKSILSEGHFSQGYSRPRLYSDAEFAGKSFRYINFPQA